ncbi:MAG: hypothetical protein HYV34_03835 [Candidatus Kerfeldbacteria bacterium]|nr:hypothetical protein [Candidatus Kerfeldbacteria bacterium]
MTDVILAVDGGGTKTDVIVASPTGVAMGRGHSGPVNMHDEGITARDIEKRLRTAIQAAMKQVRTRGRVRIVAAVAGMAGCNSARDERILRAIFRRACPALPRSFLLVNDVMIARRAGSDQPYGLALIAGTGSNGYGINPQGQEAWVSGIGHYASDDGSAYDIGMRVLRAAAQSADGRGEHTLLEPLVIHYYGLNSIREIEWPLHHQGKAVKTEIAKLAPLADHAARKKDRVAREILHAAADAQVCMATTLLRRLNMKNRECSCVCIGGVFSQNTFIWKRFCAQMKRAATSVHCQLFRGKPVDGAVKLAIESMKK